MHRASFCALLIKGLWTTARSPTSSGSLLIWRKGKSRIKVQETLE